MMMMMIGSLLPQNHQTKESESRLGWFGDSVDCTYDMGVTMTVPLPR